jgi:excisionase family DNA binding protein
MEISSAQYLKIDDVCSMLQLPKTFIYEHTRRGSADPIPSYRIGKHLRFKREEIEIWMEKHRN